MEGILRILSQNKNFTYYIRNYQEDGKVIIVYDYGAKISIEADYEYNLGPLYSFLALLDITTVKNIYANSAKRLEPYLAKRFSKEILKELESIMVFKISANPNEAFVWGG